MRRAALLLGLALLAACASGGGGGGSSALYRRDVGNATFRDAYDLGLRIIHRHHYELFNQDTTYPELRLETHWRERNLFDDERTLGANRAESRLLVYGRARGQSQGGSAYNVNLTVENRIRLAGTQQWNEGTNTEQFRAYADSIAEDFKRELSAIGVRRF